MTPTVGGPAEPLALVAPVCRQQYGAFTGNPRSALRSAFSRPTGRSPGVCLAKPLPPSKGSPPGAPQDQRWGRGLCQQGETMVSSSEPHVRHGERPWPRWETGPSCHRGRGGGRNHRPRSPPPPGRLGPPRPGNRAGSLLGKGSGLGHSRAGDGQGPDLLSSANSGPRPAPSLGARGQGDTTAPRALGTCARRPQGRLSSSHPSTPGGQAVLR